MARLTRTGDAIEGLAVGGQSRKPLKNRGTSRDRRFQGLYVFTARFNVRARIAKTARIAEIFLNASLSPEDEIICDTALVVSATPKYTSNVTKGSASHKTTKWYFAKRTGVRITEPHQGIANARRKRGE